MSSSFEIKVPPKRHDGENKWLSFALLVTVSAQELLEAAKKSEIIGQVVNGLIPVVRSLISAIGQNLNAKIDALSIELRSYLDMIKKAYALDKDPIDELIKILISLREKKWEVTDKSINNTSRI